MKRVIKNPIIMFIFGALIFGFMGTVFAYSLLASTTGFTPRDSSWEVDNVKEALDDLRKETKNRNITCILLNGVKETIGSKYACNPGDGNIYYFYILNVSNYNVQMIMDRNLLQMSNWNNAVDYFKNGSGVSIANSWNKVQSVDLPSLEDITNSAGGSSFQSSQYCYLFDYLDGATSYGCSTSIGNVSGYWLTDGTSNGNGYYVFRQGFIATSVPNNSYLGIRPMIVVKKKNLSS